ncbi:MAG: hypothetical protein ACRD04_14415 [Terriglobales bacterium]
MKLGAEKKSEVIVLVVLLVTAALLLGRELLSGGGGDTGAAVAATAMAGGGTGAAAAAPLTNLDPRLHLNRLAAVRAHRYQGSGRNLFAFGAAPGGGGTAGDAAARRTAAERQAMQRRDFPIGPAAPAPLPLTFYGFAQAAGMPEKVFVQFGQDTFVVSQGATIAHRYQIEAIGKASVRVKDLMTQSEQEVPLQRPANG